MRRATQVLLVLAAALAGAPAAFADVVRPRATTAPGERPIGYSVPEAPAHCGPAVCVHYVATTDDAPPLDDADADGVPDYA